MTAAAINTTAHRLGELMDGIIDIQHLPTVDIHGITLDSRSVERGYAFIALRGDYHHGLDFLEPVIEAGVAAILVDANDPRLDINLKKTVLDADRVLLEVPALGEKIGIISARFFNHPSKDMQVVGVTGTDGKTSVSQFIAQALHDKKNPCGIIGTLGNGVLGKLVDSGMTTPDAVSLQQTLSGFRNKNARYISMEVSSHALAQGRTNTVSFDVAVLTNLGRDHLDYHGTVEAYHAEKMRLLNWQGVHAAVVNIGDSNIRQKISQIRVPNLITYTANFAYKNSADIYADNVQLSAQGVSLDIVTQTQRWSIQSALLGRFNVENILATFAVLHALGFAEDEIVKRIKQLTPVTGRAECFSAEQCPTAVVDYSHTPQSLKAILQSIREHCEGKLWCIFGCGGDRDKGKRPLMATAAEKFSDRIIVTDDNPRTENADVIVGDIIDGFAVPDAVIVERDREKAIRHAINCADINDWIVVAGKGHENYQIVGRRRFRFSDREVVQKTLQELSDD